MISKEIQTPSIALINPLHARNVGSAIRLASCYGINQVWFTGNRVQLDLAGKARLPREERMKAYKEIDIINCDYFIDKYIDITPVAVEVRENAEPLPSFVHPENALYIFGPEDGSIPKSYLTLCHRFIVIPTRHCINLSIAIGTVLYDRMYKQWLQDGELITPGEFEGRGLVDWDDTLDEVR